MMDETPILVLKEEDRRSQTKSYLWVVRTGEDELNPIILYHYTPTRAGENAKQFLKEIEPGFYLMADAYQGYNKVKEPKRCCCYAHISRYLLEAIPKGNEKELYSSGSAGGVLYCNMLSSMSEPIRGKDSHTSRSEIVASMIRNQSLRDSWHG